MSGEPTEDLRLRHSCKVLGIVLLGKLCIVPKAVINEVSKNLKEVQDFI